MTNVVEMQTKLDAYRAARDLRLEEQRKVDALKKQETVMQHEIITYLTDNAELNGLIGSTHKAIVKQSEVPVITDMSALQQFIIDNDAWDLVQSLRPSAPAIRDRWEDGVDIPGIGTVVDQKLSVTKL